MLFDLLSAVAIRTFEVQPHEKTAMQLKLATNPSDALDEAYLHGFYDTFTKTASYTAEKIAASELGKELMTDVLRGALQR